MPELSVSDSKKRLFKDGQGEVADVVRDTGESNDLPIDEDIIVGCDI